MNLVRDNLHKAALVVASLDDDAADALLDGLPRAQAEALRRAVAALDRVDPREQETAIADFLRGKAAPSRPSSSGIELDEGLARRLGLSASQPLASTSVSPAPFRFLGKAAGGQVAPLLRGEHPQTVALVMSHLPEDQASLALADLDPAVQAEVIRRLVELDETHPDIVREVERGLESRITAQSQREEQRHSRLAVVAGILRAAAPEVRRGILANLARHEPELAAQLGARPPSFPDLLRLDDAALARAFDAVGPEVAVLALAGAPLQLVERIAAMFPARDAKAMRRAMEQLGPTRLSDVEEAQRQVVEAAEELNQRGALAA